MLGDIVAAVALTALVFERTASPFLSGLTFTLAFVPYLFSGALLSGLVDRVPPRRLMISCDLLSACVVALMAVSSVPVPVLLALIFVLGLVSPVSAGIRNALLVLVLPAGAFVAGRSLFRIVAQSAQVVGNGVGGLLIAVASPRGALVLDCASFGGSALVVRFATRGRPPLRGGAAPTGNLLRDSLAGMSAVLANPRVRRVLLLGWLVPVCSVAPESLAAPYVAHLGLSGSAVGWWLAAIPAGTIAGELLGIWFVPPAWRRRLVGALAAVEFVPLLVFSVEPGLAFAIALLVASGLCSVWLLGLDALILEVTPEPLLGRVFTVNQAGLVGLQGFGFAAAGALGEVVAPHVAIVIAAVAGLAVVALLAPGLAGPSAPGKSPSEPALL
jgi:predicted MFS family arabinose efflux permease